MIRSFRRLAWRPVVAAFLLVGGVAGAQPRQPDAFAAGSAAFQQGDYARALRLFEDARAAGADTAALEYNIGVCQYRLGEYVLAEATFGELAARYPAFRALAQYNRGLALLALQRRNEAGVAFGVAHAEGDERLAALAASALTDLAETPETPTAAHWMGYFSAAVGHDDNVALVDQLSLPATVAADSALTELLGYASRKFAAHVPVRLDLSAYAVRYADDHAFDQDSLRADALFQWTLGRAWRLEAGPYFANSTLGGDGFERTLGAQAHALRTVGERLTFDVRFFYDDIDSPTARFDFIAGHRERLRFGLERNDADRRLRVAYEFESQDRADPGVSPERNRLTLNLSQRTGGRWFIDGGVAHRTSRYDGLAVPRNERLVELTVGARRELNRGWLLNLDYRWADNDSNDALFGYTSRRVTAGLSRAF